MVQDQDWRQFERLVARIERALAPRGAVVRSPDRIPDLVTRKLREVDASIRFTVGSAPILITIECRRRTAVQDDTWIEQLATKKEKLGAARTIAVSVSGFSEPAKLTARLKGIDLRKLRQVTDEEIVSWMRSVTLTKVGLHSKLVGIFAEFDQAGPVVSYQIEPESSSGAIRALIRVADNKFVSPYDILMLALRSDPNLLAEAPWYPSKGRQLVTANDLLAPSKSKRLTAREALGLSGLSLSIGAKLPARCSRAEPIMLTRTRSERLCRAPSSRRRSKAFHLSSACS